MRLRIAIIGCGKAAERHQKIYQALKDEVEVVCVCDLMVEKAQKFAEALSAKSYTNYKEMLTKEDIEVVDLCLPSGIHAEVGKIILKDFKKHLLVEKPLALTLKDAEQLVSLAQKYQLKLVTVFQNRANLPVKKLKEALSQGLLGKPILFSAKFYWSRDQRYYDSASWRGTWAFDGGALAQQGCHFVDMLYYLGGPVESVFAKMGTYLANIEAEDLLVGTFKFKNGALGTIEATTCSRPKDLKAELVVLAEKGSAILGGFAMNRLDYLAIDGIENINEFISGFEKNPDHPLGYSHYTYLRSAIKYFKTSEKDPWLVVSEEAIPSLEIIIGLYESAETGKEIKFPFKPKACRLGKR